MLSDKGPPLALECVVNGTLRSRSIVDHNKNPPSLKAQKTIMNCTQVQVMCGKSS
jgi:hypothetical protein